MVESSNVGLVTGSLGLVGSYVARHLRDSSDWEVQSTSRRPGPAANGTDHVIADLGDIEQLRATTLREDVTHVFFAAYQMLDDQIEEASVNAAILENTMQALLDRGAPVRHVTVYHGGKAYGAHIGRFKTPASESDPRLLFPLFYYDQEDVLRSWSADRGIGFTIFRPDHICGVAFGPFVNLVHIVALYATISREMGQPLRFPGTDIGYRSLVQFTDARLLAKASAWAANTPSAKDQIFNISNGDFVRWVNTWPKVADYFGMELGQPFPYDLNEVMADKAPMWDRIVAKYGLQKVAFEKMASWKFGNAILAAERDVISSTIKIRQAGFGDCIDSEECLFAMLDDMKAKNLIPEYTA
jgi:nucleoside-diphosphate-sugar epimerase